MRKLFEKKVKIFGREVSVFLIALIAVVGIVSAALIPYFATLTGTVTVTQGLLVDGENWENAQAIVYSESLTSFQSKQVTSGGHILENNAGVGAYADVNTGCSDTGSGDCSEVTTTVDSVGLATKLGGVAGADASSTLSSSEVTLIANGVSSGTEARIRIDANDAGIETLDDLVNLSWDVDVTSGYIAHVDVLVDTDNDGDVDDALVFEYAKVKPSVGCDDVVKPYPVESGINTFKTLGIVDDDAYAWLSSGPPGPCGNVTFDANHMSLADWKSTGTAGIDGTDKVIALEIEVDAWISDSESVISGIVINGNAKTIETLPNSIAIGSGASQAFYVNSVFPKMLIPDTYTLTSTVSPA